MMEKPLQRCGSQNKVKRTSLNKINKRDEYNQRCGSVVQNKKNKRDEDEDDRISQLPEDILARIVSALPLKEAAATSVLSKRWRYIWTFTKNLDFDSQQTLNRLLNLQVEDYFRIMEEHERLNYIDRVNSVITQRSSKTNDSIDRFRIDFDMCNRFSSSIDSWIEFAMKNRVQTLELDLFEFGNLREVSECYILRKKLFNFNPSLKVLNLTCVNISGKVLERLLSKCPLLERLQVIRSPKLINLRILGGPLKHLDVRECFNIKKAEIRDALNLVSLCFWSDFYCKFRLSNVPKLVDLYLDNSGVRLNPISSCLSQLHILQLDLTFQTWHPAKNQVYPMLTNLKQLKLILNANENLYLLLARIIPFLKVSPCLQKLQLVMDMDDIDDKMDKFKIKPANWPPKEVEILSYSGSTNEDQLIIYFAENLVALQKIIIHPSKFDIYPAFKRSKDSKTITEEQKARDHAMQHIKEKIPTTIEFVCL